MKAIAPDFQASGSSETMKPVPQKEPSLPYPANAASVVTFHSATTKAPMRPLLLLLAPVQGFRVRIRRTTYNTVEIWPMSHLYEFYTPIDVGE
ncbi:hypothetical protein A1F94_000709 [Pyrenophora tritici-repentis]|nr:hypothetical protein A1F94_000709 [Pyrenophora tritici-repentis]